MMNLALIAAFLTIPFMMVAILVVRRILKRMSRHNEERQAREDERRCLRCGYDLRAVAVPRCPECGAMIGFEKTMAEIGLTDEEIRTIENRPVDNVAATWADERQP